eukprot:358116-Chlamydomonas_euryale.AAC.1
MDHGGWYDRTNTFRAMADCLFVAAMGPPGGGRNPVTPRYTRHFNLVCIADSDDATLRCIFGRILDWALAKDAAFPDDVRKLKDAVVGATLDVYKKVAGSLLPTPTRSHYMFNLRDISRVMQGLLLARPQELLAGGAPREKYLRLWTHETLRVFYDRLVDDKDRAWLLGFVRTTLQRRFGAEFDALFKHLQVGGPSDAAAPSSVGTEHVRSLFFGDFMDDGGGGGGEEFAGSRRYSEYTDVPALLRKVEEYLVDHDATSKRPMNLAVFLYAAEHVSRAARVLKQPGAHLMSVGVGGSGRQSLSRLAAFMSGMRVFQIEISKSYTQAEWREDLKKVVRHAGGDGKPCVFLFSDTQVWRSCVVGGGGKAWRRFVWWEKEEKCGGLLGGEEKCGGALLGGVRRSVEKVCWGEGGRSVENVCWGEGEEKCGGGLAGGGGGELWRRFVGGEREEKCGGGLFRGRRGEGMLGSE